MISSHYNFFLDLFHSKGYGVIYNTNSGSIVSIRDYNTWNFLRGNNTLNISVEDAKLLEEAKYLFIHIKKSFLQLRRAMSAVLRIRIRFT